MAAFTTTAAVDTSGRGFWNIGSALQDAVRQSGAKTGLCNVFIRHTSASLMINENADSNVLQDLENYIARLVRDGDPAYLHDQEGPDDMAAHIRSVLTQTEITIPVQSGRLALGTWQGLFLWEHRLQAHQRNITLTLNGTQET